jgi:hypothetical protein
VTLRPLLLASGVTLGDYLLWHWSLNSNHDALALLSGLTLPPLGVACAWLLALSLLRVLGRYRANLRRATALATGRQESASASAASGAAGDPKVQSPSDGRSSGRLAA